MPEQAPPTSGPGYLMRGMRMWITSPRLMVLGAFPALIVGAVYVVAFTLFAVNIDAVAVAATPFAEGWADGLAQAVRFAVGVALMAAAVIVSMVTFVGVTLAVGDPFYERIAQAVEARLGGAPPAIEEPRRTSVQRAIVVAIRFAGLTALIGLLIFAAGLVPVAGPFLSPMLGVVGGGSILALETSGFAFDARRVSFRDRRRMLARRRAVTLGFGILTYILFLIPLGAIVIMPAAVAGATMLARDSFTVQNGAVSAS